MYGILDAFYDEFNAFTSDRSSGPYDFTLDLCLG